MRCGRVRCTLSPPFSFVVFASHLLLPAVRLTRNRRVGHAQDDRRIYLLFEYVPGGELFSHLRRDGRFSNDHSRYYACEIALAFEYLHSMNIVYRDLKPENLLISSKGHIKITDFGFAKVVDDRTWTVCALTARPPACVHDHTSSFAPVSTLLHSALVCACARVRVCVCVCVRETCSCAARPSTWHLKSFSRRVTTRVLTGGLSASSSTRCSLAIRYVPCARRVCVRGLVHRCAWCATRCLMVGVHLSLLQPFFDETPFGIYQKILSGKIEFPKHFTVEAKDLIRKLLTADRTKRLGTLATDASCCTTCSPRAYPKVAAAVRC
ncbi:hypothetical protein EON66_06970 [archaeon]|nr:MAG: hypothetical protein EON66_06970 [archaeon]